MAVLSNRDHEVGKENYFFPNAGSLDVVKYIIERFVNDSRGMGTRFDDKLLSFLAARDIPHVDTAQYILTHYRHNDGFEGLRAPLASGLMALALLGH